MQRPHQLLLGGLLLLLSGFLGLLLLGGDGTPDGPGLMPSVGDTGGGDTGGGDNAVEADATPGDEGVIPALGAQPERTDAPVGGTDDSTTTAPSSFAGSEVIVRDGENGPPVEGATVRFIEHKDRRGRFGGTPSNTYRNKVDSSGTKLTTDAEGRVRLPRVEVPSGEENDAKQFGWTVAAFFEGKYAVGEVAATGGATLQLTLEPDETLQVLAVDPSGQPVAGIPLRMERDYVRVRGGKVVQRNGEDRIYSMQAITKVSNEQGMAVVPHWQFYRTRFGENRRALRIEPEILTRVDVSRPLPLESCPTDPVTVKLPPMGTVLVRMLDPQGQPVHGEGSVGLTAMTQKGDPPPPGPKSITVRHSPRDRGPYRFERVGLGVQLRVTGKTGIAALEAVEAAGPTGAGQEVTIDASVRDRYLAISGRLLTPPSDEGPADEGTANENSAAPWTGRTKVQLFYPTDDPRSRNVTPDGEGRFTVWFYTRKEWPTSVLFTPDSNERMVRVPTAALGPTKRLELGDLMLQEPTVLARGRVVNDVSEPVEGVAIRLYRLIDKPRNRIDRQRIASMDSRTDADGRFEIRGLIQPGTEAALRLSKGGHVQRYTEKLTLPSPRDLQLVLSREGTIELSAVTRLPLGKSHMRVRFKSEASTVTRQLKFSSGRAKLSYDDLRPGVYAVQFLLNGFAAPVHEVAGVVVRGGEKVAEPRLQEVAIGQGLHHHRIRLDNSGLTTGPSRAYLIFDQPAESLGLAGRALRIEKKWQDIILPFAATTAVLYAKGYPPTKTVVQSGQHAYRLPAAGLATVRLVGLLPDIKESIPEGGNYQVELQWQGAPQWPDGIQLPKRVKEFRGLRNSVRTLSIAANGSREFASVNKDGEATFKVPAAGKVEVKLRVSARWRGNGEALSLGTMQLNPMEQSWAEFQAPTQALQESIATLAGKAVGRGWSGGSLVR